MRTLLVLVGILSACNAEHSLPFDPSALFPTPTASAPAPTPTMVGGGAIAGTGGGVGPIAAQPVAVVSAATRVTADGFSVELADGWTQQPATNGDLIVLARTTAAGVKQRFSVARLADELPPHVDTEVGCSQFKSKVMGSSHVSMATYRLVTGRFGTGCEVATIRDQRFVLVTVIPSTSGLPYSALCSGEMADFKEAAAACDKPLASWRTETATGDDISFAALPEARRVDGPGLSIEVPAGWALQSKLDAGTYLLAIHGTTAETVRTLKVFGTAAPYVTKTDDECRAAAKKLDGLIAARSIPTYDDSACEIASESGDVLTVMTFQPDKAGKLLAVRCAGSLSEGKALIADCHEIAKSLRLR